MLRSLGHDPSPAGVAALYAGLVDALVIDLQDAGLAAAVRAHGIEPVVAPAIMRDSASRRALAAAALEAGGLAVPVA
jgi:LPPG:FO 2-phospho-L-lactate transferase